MTATEVLATPRLRGAIDRVLIREGGYAADPRDRGGETAWGITARFAAEAGYPPEALRELTRDRARELYAAWLVRSGLWQIPDDRLREAVVDEAVHSGTATAVRQLQTVLGVMADGRFGPRTLAALQAADAAQVREHVIAARLVRLGRLLQRPGQVRFATGWLRRVAEVLTWRPEEEA